MHDPVAEALASIFNFFCELFPEMLDLNLTASIVILFVICVRQFLKGAPKIFSYALWGIVLLRLLVPVSIESSVSVVPERTEFSSMVDVNDVLPSIEWEDARSREIRENTPPGQPMVLTGTSVDPQVYLSFIWLAGMVFLTVRSLLSYLGLRKRVKVSIPFRKEIYIADDIDTPFVMGFLRPKIYLPGTLDPSEREYIIAHERHHIRRGDHIFKALAFLALTIHWFNPFVWAAFVLAGRDMEMSCDEAVIRKLGEDVRAEYAASLLNLATGQRLFAGTPLAFGEGDPTGRVRNLAKWKKPAFWVILICLIVCVILAVCLLTDPEMPFPTEFEQYFVTDKKVELLSGSTNEISSKLHITLKSTSGPQRLTLELWYHRNSEEQWVKKEESVISTQGTCTFTVPSDSMFAVAATADGGKNGYATVALSAGQGIVFDKFEHDLLTRSNTKSADEVASAWTVPEEAEERIKSLEELPELYSAEQAMIDGCFVSEDGHARDNQEAFHSFAQNAASGIPGFIRLFNCHYGEDYQWNAMDLSYDGDQFILQGSDTYTFRYLKHFTGEKDRPDAAYDSYEYYVLTNDNTVTWEDILNHRVDAEDHWTVYAEFTYRTKHPDLPDRPNYAILEFAGDGLITITDSDRLEKLVYLFENSEFLDYEPKTHSIGVGLNLIFTSGGEDFVIELDPDSDVCRIHGEYVSYGAPNEPDYIYKLWEYLGITQWPDIVYMVCENALRP